MRTTLLALPLAFVLAASFAATQPEAAAATPAPSGWSEQLQATLESSLQAKHGIVFYVDGQAIPGSVRQIGPDYVIVANQEHGQVVIRLDRVDAVAVN
jgi:hypothetical protein